jgi:hypothetical protein
MCIVILLSCPLEITIPSLPHSWLLTFSTRVTRRIPLVEQELNTALGHVSPPPPISGIVRHHWKEIEKSETLAKLLPEPLDTFSYALRPADVTVKVVSHIRCFAIDIAKDLILLSCSLAMEHLCALNLYHWPQSKLERESKTKKREFLDPQVTNITSGGHKQEGLNLLLFNFLTSSWSFLVGKFHHYIFSLFSYCF